MSTPDHSIDGRLLKSAKKHFLANGFLNAQLKTICDDAGITTGALYKRYKSKEELFEALVKNALKDIYECVASKGKIDLSNISNEKLIAAWTMTYDGIIEWMRFCFERYDAFVLLVRCAEGTQFANFRHEFCADMTEIDYDWLVELQQRGLCRKDVDKRELHLLLTAYWEAYYEPFVHGYSWEELEQHAAIMCRFFDWKKALDIQA